MTLRFNSLKTRTALAMSAVIVAILLANALYMILTKKAQLREGIEKRGLLTREEFREIVDSVLLAKH